MAQVTSFKPRPFDDRWRERLNLVAKVLRDVQNIWLQSALPFPSQSTAAVVFQIFAFDFRAASLIGYRGVRSTDLWRRSIAEWFASVSEAESECVRLCPVADRAACADMAARMCAILNLAAELWETLSPLDPSCEAVVLEVLHTLVDHRFAHL